MPQRASYTAVTKEFGFNRYALCWWRFEAGPDGQADQVRLHFIDSDEQVLQGPELERFRNWIETNAAEAPGTFQYTMWEG